MIKNPSINLPAELKKLSRKQLSQIFLSLLTPPAPGIQQTELQQLSILAEVAEIEGFATYLEDMQHSSLVAYFNEETPEGRLIHKGRYELAAQLAANISSANNDLIEKDIDESLSRSN